MKNIFKTIIIMAILIAHCSLVPGQTLSPKVIPTSGGYATGGGVSLSWTMGETFTATLTGGSNKLSQGQQQPEIDLITATVSLAACAGSSVSVPFIATGYVDAANVFTAQLSDASGSFASPTNIGTVTSVLSGSIYATIPLATPPGVGYRIRVVSGNPVYNGKDNGANISINGTLSPSITGATSICTGSSTTLDAGTFTSYNWSSGATTQTISANTAGTYTVIVTNGAGCSGTAQVTVTANTLPTPAITGATALCAGSSTTLDGGAYTSYNWSTGATTQTIAANIAGTFTVTVTDANGCTGSAQATVTINAVPTPAITGGTVFCAGSSTTLNAGSWSLYNWSTGATMQNISTSAAGTYTVTVTNGSGCTGSTPVTTTVNAVPSPSISGASSICAGNSTILNAGAGFSSYSWSTGTTTQTILVNISGTYTVSVTNGFGCTGSANKTVIVNPLPTPAISGTSAICSPSSTSLNAGAGYSSYNWSTGSTLQSINVIIAGTYIVTVNNTFGCTGSATKTVTVSNGIPAQPAAITGNSIVCKSTAGVYSVPLVADATTYTWIATAGASISSGQGTNTVTVSFNNAATSASLSVTAGNACGTSTPRTLAYTVTAALPSQPSTINGQLYAVCNLASVAYNCPIATNASSYLWTVPAGVAILSGQGTNAITVKYTSSFTGSGTITVAAVSGCGSSAATSRTVNAKPQQPVISGQNWACKNQVGLNYSVVAVVGATSYTWTVVPGSTIVSGQGTTSIVVNWGAINGVIKCKANNTCGSSLQASFSVAFTCKEAGTLEDFSELSLHPNPAKTSAEIQFDGYAEGKGELAVYDLIGQQVLKQDVGVVTGINNHKLDLSSLAKGAYMIKVTYNGLARNCKLIVQ